MSSSLIDDLKLAATKMRGAGRRAFLAEMTLKHCHGSARVAEVVFGWGRDSIKVGQASSGVRTQFLKRMAELSTQTSKAIQLLYYPPYHSKYNPVERCWGILERHWNGTKLVNVGTMLAWAESMTWKGIHPVVTLSRTIYQKGVTLSKKLMRKFERQLERNPDLPKWDILIRPS